MKDCKNASSYAITNEELFYLKELPKKVLIVGGGVTALECAGFMSNFCKSVSLMTRNYFLGNFDQEITSGILDNLKMNYGVILHEKSVPI